MSNPTPQQIAYRTKMWTEPCMKCDMMGGLYQDQFFCYKEDKYLDEIKDCVTRTNLKAVLKMQGGTWNKRYPPITVGNEEESRK